MKVLSVTSGGMDSISMAAKCIHDGHEVALFHGDLKQKSEASERRAVKKCAKILGVKAHFVDLSWLGELGGSSLTDEKIEPSKGLASLQESLGITSDFLEKQKAGEGLWTPARNVVLLASAAAFAERFGFGALTWGANQSETAYPDNTIEFATRFEKVLELGCLSQIRVMAPLYEMDKVEILKWGFDNGFGELYAHTWSCDLGGRNPCGECGCCMNRRLAFLILYRKTMLEELGYLRNKYVDIQNYKNETYFSRQFLFAIHKRESTRGMWFDGYYDLYK